MRLSNIGYYERKTREGKMRREGKRGKRRGRIT